MARIKPHLRSASRNPGRGTVIDFYNDPVCPAPGPCPENSRISSSRAVRSCLPFRVQSVARFRRTPTAWRAPTPPAKQCPPRLRPRENMAGVPRAHFGAQRTRAVIFCLFGRGPPGPIRGALARFTGKSRFLPPRPSSRRRPRISRQAPHGSARRPFDEPADRGGGKPPAAEPSASPGLDLEQIDRARPNLVRVRACGMPISMASVSRTRRGWAERRGPPFLPPPGPPSRQPAKALLDRKVGAGGAGDGGPDGCFHASDSRFFAGGKGFFFPPGTSAPRALGRRSNCAGFTSAHPPPGAPPRRRPFFRPLAVFFSGASPAAV